MSSRLYFNTGVYFACRDGVFPTETEVQRQATLLGSTVYGTRIFRYIQSGNADRTGGSCNLHHLLEHDRPLLAARMTTRLETDCIDRTIHFMSADDFSDHIARTIALAKIDGSKPSLAACARRSLLKSPTTTMAASGIRAEAITSKQPQCFTKLSLTDAARTGQAQRLSSRPLQCIAKDGDDRFYLSTLDDERRRESDNVAGYADQQAPLEAIDEDIIGARARRTITRRQFDGADKAEIADIDHMRQALQ